MDSPSTSTESARLSVQSSELGSPAPHHPQASVASPWVLHPSPASECCSPLGPPPPHLQPNVTPPPLGPMGGDILVCGGGGRENPAVRTTGQKLSCSSQCSLLCYIKTKNITNRLDSCKGYDKFTCEVMRWL